MHAKIARKAGHSVGIDKPGERGIPSAVTTSVSGHGQCTSKSVSVVATLHGRLTAANRRLNVRKSAKSPLRKALY